MDADALTHVHISGGAFDPNPVTVQVGDTVEWDNHDGAPHTATADDGTWESPVLNEGESWSRVFDAPGTWAYHCAVHPSMTATLVVEGPANAPPEVSIGSPAPGSTLSGVATIAGLASDADGDVERVEVLLDGGAFALAAGTTSWTFELDTRTLDNGDHVARARAFDGLAFSALSSLAFSVDNPVSPEPPVVAITSPSAGATVRGEISVTGTASDPDGSVTRVEVAVDGGAFALATGTGAWSFALDSTALANGAHTLRARSFDGTRYGAEASIAIVVENLPDLLAPPGGFEAAVGILESTLTVTVSNSGTASAGTFIVAFHYRYDDEWHPIGAESVNGLLPGQSKDASVSWDTLGFLGEFEVRATIDSTRAVHESSEENNVATTTAVCVVDGPPLVATALVPA